MFFKRVVFFLIVGIAGIFLSTEILQASESGAAVSGSVQDGFRILKVNPEEHPLKFTVYRGDYIKFVLPKSSAASSGEFPTLKQQKPVTGDVKTTAYFKMKKPGTFSFIIGSIQGEVTVINFQKVNYRELTAQQADDFIKTRSPVILDVRTRREYHRGHLENSVLIPVQELQARIGELKSHTQDPILIYCATGNRSTVASKILLDARFSTILNLRRGIVDWARNRFPVVN